MTGRYLVLAIFLRHGQTEYTNTLSDSDLTNEGIRTIRESANFIKHFIAKHQEVVIITCPLRRAVSSASIIAAGMEYKGEIKQEPRLQGAVIKNKKRAKALFRRHLSEGGMRALCVAYGNDPAYENPEVIEPRSEIKRRFFEYFSRMIRGLLINQKSPPCLTHVSHYETLYHFVERIFELDYQRDEPLTYGEVIMVSIFDIGIQNVVELEITFRGEVRKKLFDYKTKEIR